MLQTTRAHFPLRLLVRMTILALRDSSGSANDSAMVMKFWLIADGIFIWEFFTSLRYEWSVIRGRQPYRLAVWIYAIARWATLVVVILDLVSFCIVSEINCQAWAYSFWTFGVLGLGSGSLLINLRIFAIWNMQKAIVALSTGVWVANVSLMIVAAARIRTVWEPAEKACVVTNFQSCKASLIALVATDVILLLIMLSGLLRLRRHGGYPLDLGRLLWKQGCIWVAIATAAELPQVILVVLDVSDVMRMLFLVPAMIAMTIASTRMYRSLTNFSSTPNTAAESEGVQRRNRFASNSKQSSVVHKLSKHLEVTVHTAYEEHPISHETHCDGYQGSDGQVADKSDVLSVDDKVEGLEGNTRQAIIDIHTSVTSVNP